MGIDEGVADLRERTRALEVRGGDSRTWLTSLEHRWHVMADGMAIVRHLPETIRDMRADMDKRLDGITADVRIMQTRIEANAASREAKAEAKRERREMIADISKYGAALMIVISTLAGKSELADAIRKAAAMLGLAAP